MPRSNSVMIHKLQQAINDKFGERVVVNKTQFYSVQTNRPINMWVIKKAEEASTDGKLTYKELFSSPSQLQIVLFMRDYWYSLNGWEIPTDNEMWEQAKEAYNSKQEVM